MNTPTRALRASFVDPVKPAFVQAAALCLRHGAAGTEVLLVQTLRLRQWVIPKGWPMDGISLAEAAAREAWEEAGVQGSVWPRPVGYFTYAKVKKSGLPVQCCAHVFRLDVDTVADQYPEMGKRTRVWRAPDQAATMVRDPELGTLLRSL